MVNHTRNEHHYTVVIITWLIILGMNIIGYNYMVNHTRNEHHYTVVIITWLIIIGMNTIIQWL
jgi:hypothetical protein